MDSKQLTRFRHVLLNERERILNNSKSARQADELSLPAEDLADESDLAAHDVQQNLMFQLRDRERTLLSEIQMALERIESGTYGICEETEEPIELERLLAMPWTRLSLTAPRVRENKKKKFA